MNAQLKEGKPVTVISFGGLRIKRTVVKDLGDVVLICKPEEYSQAIVENREPVAVGFKKEFVIAPT